MADPISTPNEAYQANGTVVPDAEKNEFITDLGGALRGALPTTTTLKDVSDNADAAQSDATQAISDAATADAKAVAAAATADAACPDDEAVKLTGAQTVAGKKSFATQPEISIPSFITYGSDDMMRYSDILTLMGGVKTKIVSIGDWNMNASGSGSNSTVVTHGVADYTNIRSVEVVIRHDSGFLVSFEGSISGSDGGNWNIVDNTNINLSTATGGAFDNSNYDSTSFNRGYVVIRYIDS